MTTKIMINHKAMVIEKICISYGERGFCTSYVTEVSRAFDEFRVLSSQEYNLLYGCSSRRTILAVACPPSGFHLNLLQRKQKYENRNFWNRKWSLPPLGIGIAWLQPHLHGNFRKTPLSLCKGGIETIHNLILHNF